MIVMLAVRNLIHDRIRLMVTLIGIVFSVVLVAVQMGLYLGANNMIVGMIDHARGELWITAYGVTSFEEARPLTGRERYAAMSTPGVAAAIPIISSFAEWRKPEGGSTISVVVGADPGDGGLQPWGFVEGSVQDITAPSAVVVDKTYLSNLGISGVGATAEIERNRVKVTAITEGIRSFTMSPYVFMTLERARNIMNMSAGSATFFLIQLQPGADPEATRQELKARLPNVSILTKEEFRDRNLDQWLFATGAGAALIGGALLGLLVGTVIVAQTLYSSTKDHLNEFATLRALGSSSQYLYGVILTQAGLNAVFGYALGMGLALIAVMFSEHTALPIVMTPLLAAELFLLTLAMCAISAISAIFKVTRIDPAMVFNR